MATIDGRWEPGIGDPTVGGWITVAGYAFAAWCCWRAGKTQRTRGAAAPANFWLLLAVAMGLLGINKQLDLQTALTQFGRDLALSDGWYEQRHGVQAAFIASIALAGGIAAVWLGRLSWPLSRGRMLALAGIGLLLVFVLVRASSFHHVDIWLSSTAFGLRWNWIVELSAIALVAYGTHRERRMFTKAAPQPLRTLPPRRGTATARPEPAASAAARTAPTDSPPGRPAPAVPRRRADADDRQVLSPGDPRTGSGD